MNSLRTAATALLLILATTCTLRAGKNVVVVLDDSGSMKGKMAGRVIKMDAAKQALTSVLETIPDDAQFGILLLNGPRGNGHWAVPLGPIDKTKTRKEIQKIRTRSGTPLGKFMKIGSDALLELREKQHYGIYSLLIVTDGEANDREKVERYLPDIKSRGITVDVIGVKMKSDHSLATRVHSYRRADDPKALTKAISDVFAESTDGSSNVSGETDFEYLAGFPDEVAAAALTALSDNADNRPIGELRRTVSLPRQRHSDQLARNTSPPPNATPSAAGNTGRTGRKSKFNRMTMFLVLVVVLSLIRVFSKLKRRRH